MHSLTSVLDEVEWSILLPDRFVPPRKEPLFRTEWSPESVWTFKGRRTLLLLLGIDPQFLSRPACNVIATSTGQYRLVPF